MRRRFSSPVRRLSTAENWPVTPMAARTASGSAARSCPATLTWPPPAGIRVDRIWTAVVFPAPLGPSSAKIVPSATARSMPSSTTLSPKDFRSPAAEMARVGVIVVPFWRGQQCSGPVDHDVAVAGPGADLDDLVGGLGAVGGGELVVHAAEVRVQVEPGGGARAEADLDLAEAGLERGRAAGHPADPDVAVAGAGVHVARRPADGDLAVGAVDAQVRGHVADPGLAVGVLDHRRAVDLAQADPPGARADLGRAGNPVHLDPADPGAQVCRADLIEADAAGAGLEPALPERSGGAERGHRGLGPDNRAGRQLDGHVDRPGPAGRTDQGQVARSRGPDQDPGRGALHPGSLGRPDVVVLGRVAGPDLDDRVPAFARRQADVAESEIYLDGNRFRGVEFGHDGTSVGGQGCPGGRDGRAVAVAVAVTGGGRGG